MEDPNKKKVIDPTRPFDKDLKDTDQESQKKLPSLKDILNKTLNQPPSQNIQSKQTTNIQQRNYQQINSQKQNSFQRIPLVNIHPNIQAKKEVTATPSPASSQKTTPLKKQMDIKTNNKDISQKQKFKTTKGETPLKKPKKVKYSYAGNSWLKILKITIPKEMIPTNKTGQILGFVFMFVLILGLVQFPLGRLLGGDLNVEINVGKPWPFLVFSMSEPSKSPVIFKGLFLDLIIYILISYAIEVIINVILNTQYFKSRKERQRIPKVFKDREQKISEKITRKTIIRKPKAPIQGDKFVQPKGTVQINVKEEKAKEKLGQSKPSRQITP